MNTISTLDAPESANRSTSLCAGDSPRWIIAAWVVVLFSSVIIWQGWKRHWQIMDDRVINIDEAHRLLTEGRPPQIGGFATTGGFNPPGLSYLIVPGLLSGDFRLVETLGAYLQHLVTLAGIWWLTTLVADRRTAVLALLFYSVSFIGISFGSWLWPRAMPSCTVWWMYFLVKWASRGSAWSLCGALCWYVFGCYIFLEFLPAALAFPLVWYAKRPPVRWLPCLGAGLFAGVLCYPYIQVELQNNFADVRMQLFQPLPINEVEILSKYKTSLETYNAETGQIDPEYRPLVVEDLSGTQTRLKRLFFRLFYFFDNLSGLFTYPTHRWGLIPFAFFLLPLVAWSYTKLEQPAQKLPPRLFMVLGWLILAAAVLANPWTAAFLMKRGLEPQELVKVLALEAAVAVIGFALINARRTGNLLHKLHRHILPDHFPAEQQNALDTLFLAFIPVWIVMAILSIMTRYFMWLWSVEVIILALGTCYFPRKKSWPRAIPLALSILAVWAIGANAMLPARIHAWRDTGYVGSDAPIVQALDELATTLKQNQQSKVRLGYHLWFVNYELVFSNFEDRYKLGAPEDQYLAIQHGIENLTKNGVGFSSDDDYRLVQKSSFKSRIYRTKFDKAENYELHRTYPGLELWKRKKTTAGSGT